MGSSQIDMTVSLGTTLTTLAGEPAASSETGSFRLGRSFPSARAGVADLARQRAHRPGLARPTPPHAGVKEPDTRRLGSTLLRHRALPNRTARSGVQISILPGAVLTCCVPGTPCTRRMPGRRDYRDRRTALVPGQPPAPDRLCVACRKKYWPSRMPAKRTLAEETAGLAGKRPTANVHSAPLAICIKP